MSSPIDQIYGLGGTQIAIAPGVTGTQVIPPAFTRSVSFKSASGGSLVVMSNAVGASPLVGYVMGSSEVTSVNGPATFFLGATGATAVAQIVFGRSAGFSQTV